MEKEIELEKEHIHSMKTEKGKLNRRNKLKETVLKYKAEFEKYGQIGTAKRINEIIKNI